MDRKYLICLICCEEFKGGCGGADLGRKKENAQSLQQFCEVILEVDKNELEGKEGLTCFLSSFKKGRGGRSGLKKEELDLKEEDVDEQDNKLFKFLKNPGDNLSICRDCLDMIKTVTEARLSAKIVEESVEKLQMLLLRELRRLQGRIDVFCREFEKMEETLVSGDLKFMENGLDGRVLIGRKEGRNKKRKISDEHAERKREIFGFREKISEVFSDFHQFKIKLVDKIACNPTSGTLRTAASSKKTVDAQVQVEIKPEVNRKPVKQPHHRHNKSLSSPPPSSPTFDETGHDDEDDNGGDMDDEPMDLDNFDNNDDIDHCENIQVEVAKPTDKRTSLRRRDDKKKYNYNSSDSDEQDDPQKSGKDDSEEFKPEISKPKLNKKFKTELCDKQVRRSDKGQQIDKHKSSTDSDEEEEPKRNPGGGGDDEYIPDEPVHNTQHYRTKTLKMLREHEPHLRKLSQFQRNLVKSVIKCQCLYENQQGWKGPEKMNVFLRHMAYLSYNVETQLIHLSGIPIKIVCQVEGETGGNGLICTKCDFNVPEGPKMQKLMYNHILAKHLNAYQCPHCNSSNFGNWDTYRNHVWKCKREEKEKFACENCGKILCDKRAFRNHKWNFHMSEQERKEALESGLMKKEPKKYSTKDMEKKFQCEQCGKSFPYKNYLERHEEIHKEKDLREQFICPKCGKSFFKDGLTCHLKYSKSCGEKGSGGEVESCEKCGKRFRHAFLLRRHVKEFHPEGGDSMPFICGTCGKAFRKRGSLKLHETTHTGEKNWKCGKCGTAFSRQNNMKRHEKSCGK